MNSVAVELEYRICLTKKINCRTIMSPEFQTTSQPEIFVSSPRQKPPMNRRLTYRPQTAQIPADSLRGGPCDTRDPRRSMNPLTGICPASRTAPCYRDASPNGERHHPAAIVHCTLPLVVHVWSAAQYYRASHPKYNDAPKGSTIKYQ